MPSHEWISTRELRRSRRRRQTFLALLLAGAFAWAAGVIASAHGADREATCWLSGCSGVCVDPAGLVLTVKHCRLGEEIDIEFPNLRKTVRGRRLYVGSFSDDDVVAYQLPPGDYPAATVAPQPPQRGEIVYSFGFPSGRLEALTGTVIGNAWYTDGTPIIATTVPARAGHSGGPLFSMNGELLGLCSTSRTAKAPERVEAAGDSNWIATSRLHAALQFVQAQAAPPSSPMPTPAPSAPGPVRRLYVFTSAWCAPCQTFASDYARNIAGLQDWLQTQGFERTRGGRHYGAVERLALGWDHPEVVRACEVATGTRPQTLPTFWVEGARDVLTGYPGPEKLKSYIAAQIASPQTPIENSPVPPIEQQPFERAPPAPPPEVEPIEPWSDLRVVILVAEQDLSAAGRLGGRLLLDQAGGAVRRRIQEATQGRADVELVSQRFSPERFAAVASAAGLTVERLHVLVLVRQLETTPLRARVIELVESAVSHLLHASQVPVEFVSERLEPERTASVISALQTAETTDTPASSWLWSAIAAVVGLLKRRFLNTGKRT